MAVFHHSQPHLNFSIPHQDFYAPSAGVLLGLESSCDFILRCVSICAYKALIQSHWYNSQQARGPIKNAALHHCDLNSDLTLPFLEIEGEVGL